ncbi:MAG: OmpA family protein [Deltaproteobacteria bacterium]|nr:OmpA family protein [Deltaproteobacteria bacterium]
MRVPAERVDDFLKSLTITDAGTGEAMPVSFPTMDAQGGDVVMAVKLPAGRRQVRISYVTESPAWKPSYRLVLSGKDRAKLQAWAVVDNVSGEDWDRVKIGVGSTSALSFRYDLHSIRLVRREELTTGADLALAPPTGGSPYAVAGKKVRVVGNIRADELADLDAARQVRVDDAKGKEVLADRGEAETISASGRGAPAPPAKTSAHWASGTQAAVTGALSLGQSGYGGGVSGGEAYARAQRVQSRVQGLASELKNSRERVRIEGYAQGGDKDPRDASLQRANALRDQLIAGGVPAEQIEAVGTGQPSGSDAVRIVATEEKPAQPEQPKEAQEGAGEGQPIGSAHFLSGQPMTIAKDQSAMVGLLDTETEAKRVYFYDPISARGSQRFAFSAVRLRNPSEYTLDSGPFTVYAESQFLGEGLSEPILPKSTAFIPYALDRSILVEPQQSMREELDELLTIQRGIVTAETRRIRKTLLALTNRNQQPAEVYVRHAVAAGFKLDKNAAEVERLGGAHLFRVVVPAGEAVELSIEEWTPVLKTVDIRTDGGIKDIALFLRKAKIEPALQGRLDDIIKAHSAMRDLEERIDTLQQQMDVYRTRVDEINFQLVTLRKVPQAERLRSHLAKKMEEISEKLQQATIEMTDLKGQRMTLQIELQDKLAELTLKREKKEEEAGAKKASGG